MCCNPWPLSHHNPNYFDIFHYVVESDILREVRFPSWLPGLVPDDFRGYTTRRLRPREKPYEIVVNVHDYINEYAYSDGEAYVYRFHDENGEDWYFLIQSSGHPFPDDEVVSRIAWYAIEVKRSAIEEIVAAVQRAINNNDIILEKWRLRDFGNRMLGDPDEFIVTCPLGHEFFDFTPRKRGTLDAYYGCPRCNASPMWTKRGKAQAKLIAYAHDIVSRAGDDTPIIEVDNRKARIIYLDNVPEDIKRAWEMTVVNLQHVRKRESYLVDLPTHGRKLLLMGRKNWRWCIIEEVG